MKKFKFLSYAAIAAFMTVGFTSCEKEDFNVEAPEIPEVVFPEEAPAIVTINPSIIAFVNGTAKNVTKEATVEFTTPTAKADGTIAATEVTINVKYTATIAPNLTQELTATEIVKVPELSRGMCCALTPTIVLSVSTDEANKLNKVAEEKDLTETQKLSVSNNTDFYYTNVEGEDYSYKTGSEAKNINWLVNELKEDEEINNMINVFNNCKEETKKFEIGTLYARSKTVITITSKMDKVSYKITKNYTINRASEVKSVDVVTFDVYNYKQTNVAYESNVGLDGTGHGHGHGHGHGDANNAGGGIVWGE